MTLLSWTQRLAGLVANPLVYRLWQAPFASQKLVPVLGDLNWTCARRVLDVGCGPGTNAALFANRDYRGVDADPRYVEFARERYGDKFLLGNAVDYPWETLGTFDVVLVNSLLHHLDDEAVLSLLHNLRKALAPEGVLHICDLLLPARGGIPRGLALLDRGKHPRTFDHWMGLFSTSFRTVAALSYPLTLCGISFFEMVYFRGVNRG
jgi:SAM-dependent methyltransferase